MPKHQFAVHEVVVRKLNAKKDAERLLHDFTGKGDDLLSVFPEFLKAHVGSGRACKKNRYIKLISKTVKGRCIWFDVEVGRWGLQGRVIDTTSHSEAYSIRSQDAPTYVIRGLLVVPETGVRGLMVAEVVSNRSFMSTLWPEFRDWFAGRFPEAKLWPRESTAVEAPAWLKYLDDAKLQKITFTSYERSTDQARRVRAREWVLRGYRGEVLPKDWIGKLVKDRVNPKSVITDIPSGFNPEETKVEMNGPGGPKTVVIQKDYPRFLHELSDDDEPRPDDATFRAAVLSEVRDTLEAMGLDHELVLAGAS
ncbi:hypothetical protein [Nocardioides alkalitolerans]|uniref:hypothetical protein n=1 Tax=Nocardioides alkalitolerans TaxID=281714 RepID=UPI00048BC167|nr:hypothetical protein [Nocardioides alkalitolerans]